MASVRQVVGRGGPRGTSTCADGEVLALKLWHEGDEVSLESLQQEARVLVELSAASGGNPSPMLFDLVGDPMVTGLVLQWCPTDLESWWRGRLSEPDAIGRLLTTLAEVARRVADVHDFFRTHRHLDLAHGDLKPSNVMLSADGRWLLSDFGSARVAQPEDSVWAESRVVVATDNFLAPEVLFHARIDHPQAADTWSLATTLFALLRLRRMVLDGAVVPSNGTGSPRFRMERMNRIIELYGRDPRRFVDRPLTAEDIEDAERLPEADRSAVRDSLRGVFGADAGSGEEALADALLPFLDRALTLDPSERFVDAAAMADGLDGLARRYITLGTKRTAQHGYTPTEIARAERDAARQRAEELQRELDVVRDELRAARATIEAPETVRIARAPPPAPPPPPPSASAGPPVTPLWTGLLASVAVLQLLTLAAVAGLVAVVLFA